MNRKMLVTLLSLLLLSATMVGGVWAQTYAPGVAEGDTFTYDITGFWSSNDPRADDPTEFTGTKRNRLLRS